MAQAAPVPSFSRQDKPAANHAPPAMSAKLAAQASSATTAHKQGDNVGPSDKTGARRPRAGDNHNYLEETSTCAISQNGATASQHKKATSSVSKQSIPHDGHPPKAPPRSPSSSISPASTAPKLSQELSSSTSATQKSPRQATTGETTRHRANQHQQHQQRPANVVAIDMKAHNGQADDDEEEEEEEEDVEEDETEKPLKANGTRKRRSRIFFNPSDSFCYWWSAVVSLAFLYNFWSLSYRFAFREIDSSTWHVWFAFDYAADAIYLIDIFVNFRTGYLEDGVLQRDTGKIAAHYRDESTLFYLDSSCLLPFDILYLSFGFCSIFRCNRLVKIHKFWSFVDRTERHTNYPNVFRTFTLVHYILVIFHWNACLFHMISKHKIIDIESLFKINNNQCADIWCQYLHAFYWSTLALTIIGGLPNPRARGEYIYVIVELFFGLFLFASVLGHVANIVTNVSAARKEFQARLDAVKTFMRTRRVSDDLQRKVIRWFDYLWISQKSSDEERSVACLPDRLKAEIAIHVNLDTLKRVDIFQATEAGFLRELVLRLKPVLFSPGDYVCRKDEAGHEMYIVSRGILEVVTNEGQTVVATFRAGSYFGEIAVLNVGSAGNKRTASVRSVGYSDLFCLSKQDLWDVLKDYPNAEARIRAVAEERLSALGGGGAQKIGGASGPASSTAARRSWRRQGGAAASDDTPTGKPRSQVAAAAGEQGDDDDDDDEPPENSIDSLGRGGGGSGDEGLPAHGSRRRVHSSASSQYRAAKRASGHQQHHAYPLQRRHHAPSSCTMDPIHDHRRSDKMTQAMATSNRLRQAISGGRLCNGAHNCSAACASYRPPHWAADDGHHNYHNHWAPPRLGAPCAHCHMPPSVMITGGAHHAAASMAPRPPQISMVATQRSSLSSVADASGYLNSIDSNTGGGGVTSHQHQLSVYDPAVPHFARPQAPPPPPLNIGQSRSFECTPSSGSLRAPELARRPDRSRSGALATRQRYIEDAATAAPPPPPLPLSSSDTIALSTPEHSDTNPTTTVLERAVAAAAEFSQRRRGRSSRRRKRPPPQQALPSGRSYAGLLQLPPSSALLMRRSSSLTRPDRFDFDFGTRRELLVDHPSERAAHQSHLRHELRSPRRHQDNGQQHVTSPARRRDQHRSDAPEGRRHRTAAESSQQRVASEDQRGREESDDSRWEPAATSSRQRDTER